MNHAELLEMRDAVMPHQAPHQAQAQAPAHDPTQVLNHQPDYFERKGCYELARAILLDCLHQLAHDPDHNLPSTRMEHRWLTGHNDHAPVSCAQVLSTLGMHPDGRLHEVFVRIALTDPAQAIRMLTSDRAHEAFGSIGRVRPGRGGGDRQQQPRGPSGVPAGEPAGVPSGAPATQEFQPWIRPVGSTFDGRTDRSGWDQDEEAIDPEASPREDRALRLRVA
jgi:hypothetical protein